MEKLHDIDLSNDFLDLTTKAQAKKNTHTHKESQVGLLEIFYKVKEIINRVKRQPTELEKNICIPLI